MRIMEKSWTTLVLVGALMTTPGLARADQACRTTPSSLNSVLHLYGFSHPYPGQLEFVIGNFDFFGASAVGACVRDYGNNTETLYLIVDSYDHLLGWLPLSYNHLCLTNDPDYVEVLEQSEPQCGITMNPLNYSGNRLVLYGQGNFDHLHGGNGVDIIYGGLANDNLADTGSGSGAWPVYAGTLLGESSNDFLFGSSANSTYLDGGAGNDGLADLGGGSDTLLGSSGNECCMYDSNNSFTTFNCGVGTDKVNQTAANKVGCETADSNCNSWLMSCYL
jgi:hypothetical protein